MKKILFNSIVALVMLSFNSCNKEERLNASDEFGFVEKFGPKSDELPAVKEMFAEYNLWLRLNFKNAKEVTNAIVFDDVNNRYGATPIDENMKASAIMFVDTLIHNSTPEFVRAVFPPEFFFVKTYNGSFWKQDIGVLGRARLVVCWPNERTNTQPITIPETHYYQDSVLTRMVWTSLSGMLSIRMPEEIPGFVAAGAPYDNRKALDEIEARYNATGDLEAYNAERLKLAEERGYISASGSTAYVTDLGQWFSLIVTESYENIKRDYLDNSEARLAKYKVFVDYLQTKYNWDIQAAGNKYRQKLDSFQ